MVWFIYIKMCVFYKMVWWQFNICLQVYFYEGKFFIILVENNASHRKQLWSSISEQFLSAWAKVGFCMSYLHSHLQRGKRKKNNCSGWDYNSQQCLTDPHFYSLFSFNLVWAKSLYSCLFKEKSHYLFFYKWFHLYYNIV